MIVLLDLLLLAILFLASKEDLIDNMVSDKYTIAFVILALFFSGTSWTSISVGAIVALVAIFCGDKIATVGAADLLIYAGLIGRLGIANTPAILLIVNVIALCIFMAERAMKKEWTVKNRGIAMLPVFFISYPVLIIFMGGY